MTTEQIEKAAQETVDCFLNGYPIDDVLRSDLRTDGINLFKDAVDFALSNQWVSVDEELPEDNRMVMAHISDINIIPDLSYCMAYYENGAWQFPDDYYYDCKVTHWMPIPKFNNENR